MLRSILLIAISSLLLNACAGFSLSGRNINPNYSKVVDAADLAAVARQDKILNAWFNCDECVSGQLRRIQEYGNTINPQLVSARAGNVTNLAAKRAVLLAKCTRVNTRLTTRGLVPPETCDQYVARGELNWKKRYELRGLEALLAIRTVDTCNIIGVDRCNNTAPYPTLDFRLSTDRGTRVYGIVP